MTLLKINTTEAGKIIFRDSCPHIVWYYLIQLIGFPIDTEGNTIDSIEGLLKNQGDNGTACFTEKSENYRTNKTWYTIVTKIDQFKLICRTSGKTAFLGTFEKCLDFPKSKYLIERTNSGDYK